MALAAVTLEDKYILDRGRVYLTGTQALVRLPMLQRQRDAAAGLNTGGIAGLLWEGSTRACGARTAFSNTVTSTSSRRSTKNSAPPRFGGLSKSGYFPAPNMTAYSPCGTARDRVSTAVAMS